MAEGKLPNLARLQRSGIVSKAADDVSAAVARGVVDVRDGRESGETQHFRFSESRFADRMRRSLSSAKVRPPATRAPHRAI